jgi:exonuclease III
MTQARPTIRLLCWNVAGRVRSLPDQARVLAALRPDVVCLQEVTVTTRGGWIEALREAGLSSAAVSESTAGSPARPLHTLTASRAKLLTRPVADLPWPERVLSSVVEGIEIVNVHSPISSKPDLVKVRTHEAVHAHLAAGSGPRLVCGDLNTPRKELTDGRVWTFARDRYGRLRPDRGERWDQAELALIKGLEPHGFRDAFRAAHGLERRELSWEWQRWGGGYRLDHLIASDQVIVAEILYIHEWRKQGLSDHSPLVAEIASVGG